MRADPRDGEGIRIKAARSAALARRRPGGGAESLHAVPFARAAPQVAPKRPS
jgi:hypothetical protein